MPSLKRTLIALAVALLAAASPAAAEIEVDVELVLAADISGSMDMGERYLQRQGHIEALRHPALLRAIQSGMHGRIAATYLEWADPSIQRVLLPWVLIEDAASAEAAARAIETAMPLAGNRTSISAALDFARLAFAGNGFSGARQLIDISGDGQNNAGRPLADARAEALADGITINGLAIMLRARPGGTAEVDTLDTYFVNEVAGGPGSFVIAVHHRDHLVEAIRRKLILEIAGLDPAPAEPWPPLQ